MLDTLFFEQDLTSFYETGELNFAVDCRGNGLPWEMEFGFLIIESFAASQRSHREAFNRKLDRMMKRKNSCTNPQHQTYTVNNASVCTEKKQTLK